MDGNEDSSQLTLFLEDTEEKVQGLALRGLDDMNIVEILLGLPGNRRPQEGKVVKVPWSRGERSYYVEYTRTHLLMEWKGRRRQLPSGDRFYVRVLTPEDIGLPSSKAGDVFVALMKLSLDDGFTSKKIQTTRHEMLQIMQWNVNGHYYDKLEEVLEQFTHMTVRTNALWNPERESYDEGNFNILDRWKKQQNADGPHSPLLIEWGSEIMEIFSHNYLKGLDLAAYYGLENDTTKRIFRWLDKHLSLYPVVEVDVLRFAHVTLGYGVSYEYPSNVIAKLRGKLDELKANGFCTWNVEDSKTDSGKKFIFTRLTDYTTRFLPTRQNIIDELDERGVDHPETIVDNHNWDTILQQIFYFDWRQKHGKPIKDQGAWLAHQIRNNLSLPKTLQKQMQQARQSTAEWLDAMYEHLSEEERDELDHKVEQIVKASDWDDDIVDDRRLKLRRRLLTEMRGQV